MKKITEQVKPVIAREPGKKNGAIGGVLIGPDGKPIKGSWRRISDLPTGQRPPQANIDNFLRIEREKARQRDSRLDSPVAGPGPKGNQVGSRPSAPPAPTAGGSGTGAGSRRPPATPTPPRQPAPESSAVREYMKAAAAARKSGDTAQMAKVRDTGLDIWRKKYAGTLAKNVNPDGTQKGTGQSVMAKQAAELRALRPAATETGPQAQSALPGGAYSPAATSKMTDRTKNILGVKEQYDAYDLVLEYLLSNGHADTLDEAHYVMMQMDGDHILNIIEDYQ